MGCGGKVRPGKLQGFKLDSRRTQLGGEDYSGLQGQTAGTPGGAKIACGGICMAKIALPGREFNPWLRCPRRRSSLNVSCLLLCPRAVLGAMALRTRT